MIRYLGSLAAFLGATLCVTAASAGTYSLCIGEYSEPEKGSPCPRGQPYAYCGVDPKAEATKLCRQEGSSGDPLVVHLRSQGGNKCGYEFFTITCQ
jgi:hypothetical protein